MSKNPFLQKNLDLINVRFPTLKQELSADKPPRGVLSIEPARTGLLTLKWDGVYLHSRYDPLAETTRFMEGVGEGGEGGQGERVRSEVAFFFGWGADYFLEEVIAHLKTVKRLYIFPPNEEIFRQSLNFFDFSAILNDPRVTLILRAASLLDCIKKERKSKPLMIAHPTSIKLCSPEMAPLRDILEEGIYGDFVRDYWKGMEGLLGANLTVNWERAEGEPGVAGLFNRYEGASCVVAGAGPSLARDIETLKSLKGKEYVVIAVDAAYRPLVNAGFLPDYTVTVDPLPDITGCFEGLAAHGAFVYTPKVDPAVPRVWKGKRYVCFLTNDTGLTPEQTDKGVLFSGGSVIHPTVDLAVRMGCKEIVLVGADFAFSDGYSHSKGTIYRAKVSSRGLQRRIESKGGVGEGGTGGGKKTLWSSKNLIAYLRELERYIAGHPEIRWINMTAQGALIAGCINDTDGVRINEGAPGPERGNK